MTLQTAFVAPNSYQTSATTMRRILHHIAPFYSSTLKATMTLTPVSGFLKLTTPTVGFDAILYGTDVDPTAFNDGAHFVWSEVAETIDFEAADATNPRWDSVILRVADPEYGTVVSAGPKFVVVKGTAAASPSKLTNAAIDTALAGEEGPWTRVANVRIPAGATQVTAGSDIEIVIPFAYAIQERKGLASQISEGAQETWVAPSWATAMTVTVPPSGKIRITVSGNLDNDADTATWLGYAMSWSGGSLSDSEKFYGALLGTPGNAAASKTIVHHSFAAPGTVVTITPQTWRGPGAASTAKYAQWMIQVEPLAH